MNQQPPFISKFLLSPSFRKWRYLLLVVFFIIVSVNQALAGYMELIPSIGNDIYWIAALTVFVYMVMVFRFSKIGTRFLLSGKYLKFVVCIVFYAILFITVSNVVFCLYIPDYSIFLRAIMVDNISSFGVYVLCISGVAIPLFLRNWIVAEQQIKELELKKASSQVEQFKEQINPPSFFKVLTKSRSIVKTEPDKASAMLMRLSQLLRYQLYDCNRQEVLLTAEISFLKNFLELEKLHSPEFDYRLEMEGKVNGIFILPSVLLPFVQSGVNVFHSKGGLCFLDIRLINTPQEIDITLMISGGNKRVLLQKELLKVRERLNMLYKDQYQLVVGRRTDTGNTEVTLTLKK